MSLFVPTASKDVVATRHRLFLLLYSSGLWMTNCLVWSVYLRSPWVTVITWWQAAISRTLSAILFFEGPHLDLDNIAFHFPDFGLSLDPVFHTELVFLPINHLIVGVSGVDLTSGQGCSIRAKYLNLFLTLIVPKRDYQVTSVQFRDVLKACQGYHNLNLTAKQPVVTSPAVQFRPVPLTKRMLVRMGQVNRLKSQ